MSTTYICEYMITPKDVMDMQPDRDKYVSNMKVPYIESIAMEAKHACARIGEIVTKDYGLCSKRRVARLNRMLGHPKKSDCESYVIGFDAEVLGICL